jgi:hypothetical protein
VRFVGLGVYSLNVEVAAYVTTPDNDEFLMFIGIYIPYEAKSRDANAIGRTRSVTEVTYDERAI